MQEKLRIRNAVPIQMPKTMRPYNFLGADTEDVEIEMYGEIVEKHPIDWWTGKPVDGLYIVLQDFLNDLDSLKNKKSIKVRINSVGGDLEAGVVIYNRLKELENVTTVIDGLAASAAGLIFQAGCKRKIYESGQFMAHGASVGLCGYTNLQELDKIRNRLIAANEQVVNIFAERTGQNKTKLKHMVEAETWLTGQAAVDEGFADEVIEGQVTMSMSADKSLFYCNGIPMQAKNFGVFPEGVKITKPTVQTVEDKNKEDEGGKHMTLEELRNQHPDLVKQIEDAAKETVDTTTAAQNAAQEERQRIQDIESIEASIADKQLVKDAKYGENPMSAKDLAFAAMQKQAQLGNTFLQNMKDDNETSGVEEVHAAPTKDEQKEKDEADMAAVLNAVKNL